MDIFIPLLAFSIQMWIKGMLASSMRVQISPHTERFSLEIEIKR